MSSTIQISLDAILYFLYNVLGMRLSVKVMLFNFFPFLSHSTLVKYNSGGNRISNPIPQIKK